MTRNGLGIAWLIPSSSLALLHALEERGLGLRGGPVDLVREDHLAHDRAGPELELLGLLVVDGETRHVRRQQVGRELDPPECAAEAARDRLRQDRLAGPGNVLDQEVAAAEKGHQRELDLVVLAHDHALDVRDDPVAGLLDLRHRAPRGAAPVAGRTLRCRGARSACGGGGLRGPKIVRPAA
jgi:hypothetical protein